MILSFLSIVSCNNKVTKTRQADLVVEYNGTKIAATGPSWTSYDELIRDLDNDEKTFILFAATWCRPCGRVLKIAKQEGWLKKIKVIKKLVEGKNLLIIDDSIVRGNTSKYILNELRKCGAKKIFLVSCCPPIRNPNIYGIAIPSYEELIAHNKTEKQIEAELNVDKLFYLDLDSLCNTLSELNPNLKHFETSVFTGNYIKEFIQLEI